MMSSDDYHILNDGTLNQLHDSVDLIMEDINEI